MINLSHSQNIIINGDFESIDPPSCVYRCDTNLFFDDCVPHWKSYGNEPRLWKNSVCYPFDAPHSGNYFAHCPTDLVFPGNHGPIFYDFGDTPLFEGNAYRFKAFLKSQNILGKLPHIEVHLKLSNNLENRKDIYNFNQAQHFVPDLAICQGSFPNCIVVNDNAAWHEYTIDFFIPIGAGDYRFMAIMTEDCQPGGKYSITSLLIDDVSLECNDCCIAYRTELLGSQFNENTCQFDYDIEIADVNRMCADYTGGFYVEVFDENWISVQQYVEYDFNTTVSLSPFEPGEYYVQIIPYMGDVCDLEDLSLYTIEINHQPNIESDVTSWTTWSGLHFVTGNLNIQSLQELTITGDVYFDNLASIEINHGSRLIIDGGKLTSCDQWLGLSLHGNQSIAQPTDPYGTLVSNNTGILIVKNDAHISKAQTAIGAYGNLGSPGGLMIVENSTISDCTRAVYSANYEPYDESYFDGATISNCGRGIEYENMRGIEIRNSSFQNIVFAGVDSKDAIVFVRENNTFDNMPNGILASATYPTFGQLIVDGTLGPNTFQNCEIGINMNGQTNILDSDIRFNIFVNNQVYDIIADGDNNYYIFENQLNPNNNVIGIFNRATGGTANEVSCNTVALRAFKIMAQFNNATTVYYSNEFDLGPKDFHLYGDVSNPGRIALEQGAEDFPALNCFTQNPSTVHIGTAGTTISFNYYYPDNSLACYEPLNNNNYNYNKVPINNDENFVCNSGGTSQSTSVSLSNFLQEQQNYQQLSINMIAGLLSLDTLRAFEQAHFQKWEQDIYHFIQTMTPDELWTVLSNLHGNLWRQKAYGYYISIGEDSLAFEIVEDMAIHPATADWYGVQSMRSKFVENDSLSNSDLNQLEDWAMEDQPFGACARGLYYKATGEWIQAPLVLAPGLSFNMLEDSSSQEINSSPIMVYPNPVFKDIIISGLNPKNEYSIELWSSSGQLIYKNNRYNNSRLEHLDEIVGGIYILRIIESGKILSVQKIVIQ